MKKLLIAGLLMALPAWCETHDLVLTGQSRVLNVRSGDSIDLVGDSNQVTIQGNCQTLNLTGSGNQVRIEGQMDAIQIVGSDNKIIWIQGNKRRAPNLQTLGSNNHMAGIAP